MLRVEDVIVRFGGVTALDGRSFRGARGERARPHRPQRDAEIGLLLPKVRVKTGEGDGYPLQSVQMMRFRDENWQLLGDVIDSSEQ